MQVEVVLQFPVKNPEQVSFIKLMLPASELPTNTPDENWRLTEYMWMEGNYSCDCNKSLFAMQQGFPISELPCGDTVKLISLRRIDNQ